MTESLTPRGSVTEEGTSTSVLKPAGKGETECVMKQCYKTRKVANYSILLRFSQSALTTTTRTMKSAETENRHATVARESVRSATIMNAHMAPRRAMQAMKVLRSSLFEILGGVE